MSALTRERVIEALMAAWQPDGGSWTYGPMYRQLADKAADTVTALLADAEPKVLCRGFVVDAGGGYVTVLVARDTDSYPESGALVSVVEADA